MQMKKSRVLRTFRMGVLLAAVSVAFMGCATSQMIGVNTVGSPMVNDLIGKLLDTQSANLLMDGMAGNLLMVTGVTEMSPHNRLGLQQCAMLYASYGMMVEDDNVKYAMELYAIGKDYGMRALSTDREFRIGLEEGKKLPELVALLDARFAPTLCWTGLNIGLTIIHQMDDPMALMGLPDAVALVRRSVELDPNYFYGVGKAFLGAYYALVPEFLGLGGGPDASAAMFEEARKITGGKFLMVDVFEARYLATYVDDEAKFDRLMNNVLTTPNEVLENGRAMNDLAKVKARTYMAMKSQLF